MKLKVTLLTLFAVFLAACNQSETVTPETNAQAPVKGATTEVTNSEIARQSEQDANIPLGPLGENVEPTHYELRLTLDPVQDGLEGEVAIELQIDKPTKQFYLHGKGLSAHSTTITSNGSQQQANYLQVHDSGIARISYEAPINGKAVLTIKYSAKYSESLDAIYKVKEGDESYLFSQMEAISARMSLPSFDEPRFKTPFDVVIVSPSKNKVITNNPEVSSRPLTDDLVEHTFSRTKPLPIYLLAFVVGDLDIVEWADLPANSTRDYSIPLRGVAAKGKGEKLKYALENTKPILESLERYFGTPYPYEKLDIIAAPDFAFGAMENAGAIIYRESLLLLDDDAPISQKRAYGSVHAHELGHQWFGNLVTPKWWDDIWLNEAFATWVTFKAVQEWRPNFEFDRSLTIRAHSAMAVDASSAARQIRNPINTNDDIMNAFDGITYQKGGGVLQMFENYVGAEKFRKGVQLHMQRFAFKAADINDFLSSIADGAGESDVIPAFESFLYQSGVPTASITKQCKDGKGQLEVQQDRYVPLGVAQGKTQQWQIPVCYKTNKSENCELVTERKQIIELDHCADWVMPNRDGAGYYRFNLESESWDSLLAQLNQLSAPEQISLADNLVAGFNAGQQDSKTLLKAFSVMVNSPNWDVSSIPAKRLTELKSKLLDGNSSEDYRQQVMSLYNPLMNQLGLWPTTSLDTGNAVGTSLLRRSVVQAVAIEANNKELQSSLIEMAKTYLKQNGQSKTENSFNPNLVDIALQVLVSNSEHKTVESMKEQALNSTDSIFRRNLLSALTKTTNVETGKSLVDELLVSDRVRSNEAQSLIANFMSNKVLRDHTWNWLTINIDNFLNNYSSFSIARIVSLSNNFCSEEDRSKMKKFFSAKQDKISGAPRKISESSEVISQCIELRKTKAEEFKLALSNQL
jgi:alanyl aminopeptidase